MNVFPLHLGAMPKTGFSTENPLAGSKIQPMLNRTALASISARPPSADCWHLA